MTTPAKVLEIAKKEIDAKYKEGNNNDTKFGKWYGNNNQPWCAYFVSWVFHQAGSNTLAGIQTPKGFHNCDAGLAYFRKHGQLADVREALPGDIVFFNLDGIAGTSEHVGILVQNQPEKNQMVTYEGNTGTQGSANGDGCYKKIRPYAKVAGVGRPDWSKTK